jgi:hypothetical protein
MIAPTAIPSFRLVAILLLLSSSNIYTENIFAEDRPLLSAFKSDYPVEIQPIVDFYDQITLAGKRTVVDFEGAETVSEEVYKSTDGCYLSSKAGGGRLIVFNPEGSFGAVRDPDGRPSLADFAAPHASADQRRIAGSIRLNGNPLFAAFSFYERSIVELLAEPAFSLTTAEKIESDGGSLIKVNWSYPMPQRERKGYFLFDQDQHWILREFDIVFSDRDGKTQETRHMRIDYTVNSGSLPIIKTVEHKVIPADTAISERIERFVVEDAKPGKVSKAEFMPAAYGITLPSSPSPAGSRRFVLASSIVFLVLAVVFTGLFSYQQQRKRRSPSSG